MQLSGSSRWLLRLGTALTLAFLYIPLIVILRVRVQLRRACRSGRPRA